MSAICSLLSLSNVALYTDRMRFSLHWLSNRLIDTGSVRFPQHNILSFLLLLFCFEVWDEGENSWNVWSQRKSVGGGVKWKLSIVGKCLCVCVRQVSTVSSWKGTAAIFSTSDKFPPLLSGNSIPIITAYMWVCLFQFFCVLVWYLTSEVRTRHCGSSCYL